MFLLLTIVFGVVTPYASAEDGFENTKFKKNRVHIGDGPPPPGLGKVGDTYVDGSDSDNLVNYKKTGKGTWIILGDTEGPKGFQISQVRSDEQILRERAGYVSLPVDCSSPAPNANLQNCNFDGLDLSHYDLSGANLNGAFLRSANLSNANLTYASLFGASLFGSDLENADLSGAYLVGANLQFTNLVFSVRKSQSYRADLGHAELRNTDLSGASLIGTNLREATIINANLDGTLFIGSNPQESIFANVNFENVFTDVNKFSNPNNTFVGTFVGNGSRLIGVIAVDAQMLGGKPLSFFLDRSEYADILPIARGGTGATTADQALANLGISTHTHQLDDLTGTVLGLIPRNVAPICDIVDRGSIYYDRDDDSFCFCNGVSWKTIDMQTCH
jgi:hypothetical protein